MNIINKAQEQQLIESLEAAFPGSSRDEAASRVKKGDGNSKGRENCVISVQTSSEEPGHCEQLPGCYLFSYD